MNITSRAGWNARTPESVVKVAPSQRVYFVVHYSGGPATQTVRAIQNWCMDEPPHGRGFSDIDYNHLVRATTGEIYEGRGWDVVGAHTTDYNTVGVGVCVIGDGDLSDAAKASVRWLYEQYNKRCGKTLTVRGHRQLATTGTDCPGDRIYAWVHAGMPAPGNSDGEELPMKQETFNELMNGWARSAEGKDAIADAAGAGVHGQRLGKSNVTIGVALQNTEINTRDLPAKLDELAARFPRPAS